MKLSIKRVYEAPGKEDGMCILVDRLWPRGLTKEKARLDLWLKDIAPSNALRKWFAHDPAKWPVTLLYAAKMRSTTKRCSSKAICIVFKDLNN